MFWGVIGATAAALLVVLLYPFRVRVTYGAEGDEAPIVISVRIFGRDVLRFPVPLPETAEPASAKHAASAGGSASLWDGASLIRSAAAFVKTLFFDTGEGAEPRGEGIAAAFRRALHTCERLEWETRLGTGDAALTALAAGGMWALKGTVYTAFAARIRFTAPPHFAVQPVWDRSGFEMRIDCIFRVRLGEIILAWACGTVHAWRKGVFRFGRRKGASSD